jgi:hypothetical protein
MAESPRRADLRLTIPASPPYAGLAGEVALRFAEYSGASRTDASQLRDEIDALLKALGARNGEAVELEMTAENGTLHVSAAAGGRVQRTTCTLSSDANL